MKYSFLVNQKFQLTKQTSRLPTVASRVSDFEIAAFSTAQLLEIEVEHRAEPINQLFSQERLLDVLSEIAEHFDRFFSQRQIGAAEEEAAA